MRAQEEATGFEDPANLPQTGALVPPRLTYVLEHSHAHDGVKRRGGEREAARISFGTPDKLEVPHERLHQPRKFEERKARDLEPRPHKEVRKMTVPTSPIENLPAGRQMFERGPVDSPVLTG